MGFTCGIVGLPNVGKSTLFNALTASRADASNYPFCTIDPNIAVVEVPDDRIAVLARIYRPARTVASIIEFFDIAGLVRGASKGEGLGNQFLSHIREVDAVVHVVRCFEDPNVVHVEGKVDPESDITVVETELILKDLETVEKRLADVQRRAKTGDKKLKAEVDFDARVREHLLAGRLVKDLGPECPEEHFWRRDLHLLTDKPMMYVCNVSEKDLMMDNAFVDAARQRAQQEHAEIVIVSAAVEAEIAQLPADERKAFLEGLGLAESGLARVIRTGYELLRLVTFFTVGLKEVHAWTVPRGTPASIAAGAVHSDFEKGFIRAEIMKFADLARLGSEEALKSHGLLHIEGKGYAVEDGDVIHFRFHV